MWMISARNRAARALALAAAALACHRTSVPVPAFSESTIGDTAGLVVRGEYLVRNAAVCGGCHAAGHRDPDGPLSGGDEFRDWRLGTVHAANLTADSATGLGRWTEAEIVRAVRNGQARDGRLLAPVMPYEWLRGLSDRDAFAIARYLKTQPAVRNEVRQRPNFWFRLGKVLFIGPKSATTAVAPLRGPNTLYGGYLARVSLCADCHTPRGGLQSAPDRRRLFAGDADPPKSFPANPANLTPDSVTGIGRWSETDFLRTIRTGVNPQGDSLHPFMPWRQIRRMTDDDLRAMYRYLRTLPAVRQEVPRGPRT